MRYGLAVLVTILAALSAAAAEPAPPRQRVDTTPPPAGGRELEVRAGGDLQAALDAARPGDAVVLEAGATFVGPFVLPRKDGDGWIVVRTSAADRLPPPGRRLAPSHQPFLATIVGRDERPALAAAPGAHHYRVVGLEITIAPQVRRTYDLVRLGEFEQTSTDAVPHHVILDRVFIHGRPDADVRRGVSMNGASCALVDSRVVEIHEAGADSQAVGGSTGPGPFKIANNLLEGAGENIMFGGADPRIRDLVPSDIEIRGNHIVKPAAWMGSSWTVKNLLELKNARRVLIEGNLLEHNWPGAQNGFAILFTVRNQDGGAPWSVVEDVTFTNNVVRKVASAINVLGTDDNHPSRTTRRIAIRNNLFEEIGAPPWGGRGAFLQLVDGADDVEVTGNTIAQTGEIVLASGRPHTKFVFRDNVAPHNTYGFAGDDHFGDPSGTIERYLPGAKVTGNVIAGGPKGSYPPGNTFKSTPGKGGVNREALKPALAAGGSG